MENKNQPSITDKVIGNTIIGIYLFLLIFGIISFIKPGWLRKESTKGKQSEASSIKNEADVLLRNGKFEEAIGLYQKSLKRNPEYLDAITNMATAFGKLTLFDTALILYNKALYMDPHYPEVIYFNIAEIFSKKGDLQSSIKYYKYSIRTDILPSYTFNRIGNLFIEMKAYDSALWYFEESMKYKETMQLSLKACLRRDYYLENRDQEYKDAIKLFEARKDINSILDNYDSTAFNDAISRNRVTAMNYNSIGFIYAITNQIEKSIPYFRSALQIWPNFPEALENMYAANQKLSKLPLGSN